MTTITFNPFSVSSINKSIAEINKYIAKLERLETELPKALAEYGATVAKANFDTNIYNFYLDGTFDTPNITVTAEPTDNGYAVVANGQEVAFVEFGAGVFFNGGDSYAGTRPPEIVGIGEYGHGLGQEDSWEFVDRENRVWKKTRGTPASNSMFYTAQEMRSRVEEEARRILADD